MDAGKDKSTDSTYVSYDKIPESANKWNLTESDYRAFKKTDWVVTEKIHGANFGIVTDGTQISFANERNFCSQMKSFLIINSWLTN